MKNNLDYPAAEATKPFGRYLATALLVSAAYVLLSALLIGFKSDQLVLAGIFTALYVSTPITRKFILGFSIFIVFWVIFDYMKAFPNYWFNEVHIGSLYNAEARLFGIHTAEGVLTPNEYFQRHSIVLADVLAGLFYLCWIPVPLGFAAYLFFRDRRSFLYFSLTFLLTNLIGFVIYYLYPAAPPWYVQEYGLDFIAGTRGNTAGLIRFDHFFNITIFQSLYTKGSNVFAAMPSLHSAYPLLVLYHSWRNNMGFMKIVFGMITVGIWFAAVYTSHHYVLDVLAGIAVATTGIILFQTLVAKSKRFARFVEGYVGMIS
ncbi:PAP2 superfamily protein [Chryseolinea serpens]|uniref:PAP2 superfamily protein n=1 Tax=Chryseolinea serpens TaxID=947013 RepID=A0A1M5UTW3_9BACT|nr:phosphatase PAP2 family protein [Chryseolinea serpens]SHH66472.1 PAP2 superfamily protein [Chryseolinea serpens]